MKFVLLLRNPIVQSQYVSCPRPTAMRTRVNVVGIDGKSMSKRLGVYVRKLQNNRDSIRKNNRELLIHCGILNAKTAGGKADKPPCHPHGFRLYCGYMNMVNCDEQESTFAIGMFREGGLGLNPPHSSERKCAWESRSQAGPAIAGITVKQRRVVPVNSPRWSLIVRKLLVAWQHSAPGIRRVSAATVQTQQGLKQGGTAYRSTRL